MSIIFAILNLLLVSGISILVVASIRHLSVRWIASFLFSLFIVLQISSLFIGGSFIDYKFYIHFNIRDMMALKGLFSFQIAFLVLLLAAHSILIFWLRNTVIKLSLYSRKYYRYGLIIVSMIVLSFDGGVISNVIDTVRILNADDASFEVALHNLGMDHYIPVDGIEAQEGKNIIVISLESYEKGYLSEAKAHLTPNMRSLAKRWNYYDMKQTSGSGWTSASLYTYLTGLPAFFKGNGNLVFQKSQDSRITGIGQVLKRAGYQMTYLVGNAKFAGMEDLLNTFQITDIADQRRFKEKHETNASWGMHDKDLFEEAKLAVQSKIKSNKPFALFMSTVATHNPDGVYDSRMEEIIEPQGSKLEFMAASVDYMVGEFMDFLEAEGILSNTTVYIFPDHLKMGDGSIFSDTGDRGLYLLTNASDDDLHFDATDNIYQIDLPKIILDGAKIEHNAKFLTDYIDGDIDKFIGENAALIATLNNSGLRREGIWTDKLFVELNDLRNVAVRFDNNIVTISSDTVEEFITSLSFSNEMRLIDTAYNRLDMQLLPNSNLTLNLFVKGGKIHSYLEQGNRVPLLKTDNNRVTFSLEDVNTISQLPESQKQGLFSWESNSFIEVKSSPEHNYLQYRTNVPYNITEGIIEIEYSTLGDAVPYVIVYGQPYHSSTIILHDKIPNSLEKNIVKFSFNKLVGEPALVFRNWSKEGKFFIHNYKIVGYGYDNGIRFANKTVHFDKYVNDKNRFIAHAGGIIEGKVYTNSLEALNNSYEKGFRLFELDIIKTSDGKYVAAHDWRHWSEITGYQGVLPVTEKEFLKHEIYGKFTPMNMGIINRWFKEHTDAILVTDKVNEPKQFAKHFMDEKRLMMELFSLDAVKEGLTLGLRSSMPSENVVSGLGGDKVAALKSMGIKDIAISRRNIARKITFLERLQANNINAYAFHVNFDEGKDEKYVVNYEMDYIYGLYADKWDFE